jgi:hypothetical protein
MSYYNKVITCCDCGKEETATGRSQKRCKDCKAKARRDAGCSKPREKKRPASHAVSHKDNHSDIARINGAWRGVYGSYGKAVAMGVR